MRFLQSFCIYAIGFLNLKFAKADGPLFSLGEKKMRFRRNVEEVQLDAKTLRSAKVDGPLFSLGASGAIGKAIVYFPWKGKHVVRGYVKPANPKSITQGFVRVAMKAIGKWVKKIGNTRDGDALDSVVYQACTSKAPAGVNWNAFIAQGFLNELQVAGTFQTSAFTDLIDVYSSLGATDLAAWASDATGLGLEDLTFNYGYTDNLPAGAQLFFGGIACNKQEIILTAPYNTVAESWVVADIDDFAEDMTSDA